MYLRLAKHRMLSPHPTRNSQLATRGLTLIEMLIGMAITLVMMAAVVTLFANIGAGIRVQRARMEIGSQLRAARSRLFKDLAGATNDGIPKSTPGDNDKADGYIEIVEGQWSDKNPSALTDGNPSNGELDYSTSLVPSGGAPAPGTITNGGGLGDYDDILALTVRSDSEPFVGRFAVWEDPDGTGPEPFQWVAKTIESNLAEVIWFAVENPADGSLGEPGMRTIYRRVLLIAPWVQGDLQTPGSGSSAAELLIFYSENDISVRLDSSGTTWIPNTLSDLIKRENRFGHFLDSAGGLGFPFAIDQTAMRALTYNPSTPPAVTLGPLRPFGSPFDTNSATRQGEDVMLNNVLAFDVRVFDPGAPLFNKAGAIVEPSDFGWDNVANSSTPVGYGAYTDLYWNAINKTWNPVAGDPTSQFDSFPHLKSRLNFSGPSNPIRSVTYDTWSFHYENDGIDQDDNGSPIDEGTDGLDTNGINGTDDIGERETMPPYDVPLRGIQVKLRVYEPDTRQIREATITKSFVPQ